MLGKIFINYRREDSQDAAGRIYRDLQAAFGTKALFMDVDNLLAGQRFDRELEKALLDCQVLIAVIGPRWMDALKARSESGERDYVREEIAGALQRQIAVIPVLVNDARLPIEKELPDDMRDLPRHQKHDLRHAHFGRDMAPLIEAIKALRAGRGGGLPKPAIAASVAGVAAVLLLGAYAFIGGDAADHGPSAGTSDIEPVAAEQPREEPKVAALAPPEPAAAPVAPSLPPISSSDGGEVALTDRHVAGYIAAQRDFQPLADKLASSTGDDPTLAQELETLSRRHGFSSFSEYDAVGSSIAMVLAGLDSSTGAYQDPVEKMRQELADIAADASIPAEAKKLAMDDLTQEIASAKPLRYPENIAVVKRHRTEIEALVNAN